MKSINYAPIGIIHSPLKQSAGSPIQAATSGGIKGRLEIFPRFLRGLNGLSDFSHLILIYDFHLSKRPSMTVRPYLDSKHDHGVFSTRSPSRPNSIGISVVRVRGIRGNNIFVQDVDVIDGTPLLDIKPYVPAFDHRKVRRIGWYAGRLRKLSTTKADDRFSK